MAYKPVGVDDTNTFPARVMTALRNFFVVKDSNASLPAAVLTRLAATFLSMDSVGNIQAIVITYLKQFFFYNIFRSSYAGSSFWGIPGTSFYGTQTVVASSSTLYYTSFEVRAPAKITALAYSVSANSIASATNTQIGVYAADAYFQPTGPPLITSGVLSIAASTTGNVKYTLPTPVTLPPGLYVVAVSTSAGITYLAYRSPSHVLPTMGPNGLVTGYTANSAYGPIPTTPAPWSAYLGGTNGMRQVVLFQWTES